MARLLVDDGDRFEQLFGHYVAARFPAYELFWSEFVVPLTRRPDNVYLLEGLDPLLARMAETHYSLFRHLVAAHRLLDSARLSLDVDEIQYDAVFLFMSAATEMVEDFLVVWARVYAHVGGLDAPLGFEPLSPESEGALLAKYLEGQQYKTERDSFLEGGRPISYTLHAEPQLIDSFSEKVGPEATEAWKEFKCVQGRVRHYRNTIAHRPTTGKWVVARGAVLCAREEHLADLDAWQKVVRCTDISHFDYPANIAAAFLVYIEDTLNGLWLALLPKFRSLANQGRYTSMIPGRVRATAAPGEAVAHTGYQFIAVLRGDGEAEGADGSTESSAEGSGASSAMRHRNGAATAR